MTSRFTIAARITLIVVMSLVAAWIVGIAVFYRFTAAQSARARPSAERVAAVVDLVERAPPAERALALRAIASPQFSAQLLAGESARALPADPRVAEFIRRDYAAALGDRSLDLVWRPTTPLGRFAPRLAGALTNALEFRIALRSGETLLIDTRGALVLARTGLPIGLGAGLFGTLVALGALIVTYRETKPLARLAAAVDAIDLSGSPAPLPQPRGRAPEARALIAAFERLQARLSALLRARLALVGGISHDVRTFATRLRLRVEQIADETERRRAIGDIEDMIRLLDDALLSSRAGAGELTHEMVDIAALVETEIADRREQDAAVDLRGALPASAPIVLGDRLALRRILANLVDNALKYGHVAHVSLTPRADAIEIVVEDEGPGIPEPQRELMLEPFSRLEASRSRGAGGAGLGLSIVRAVAEAHGGAVAIGRSATGGGRITVALPLFQI
ncbi:MULTISPECIES: sensor histidine kinase [Methylosinus]|uniref:histidine kinase n=1 Tax=Methylosinus trichosporium (strain ATCC 35070 / NCIMB 11131 / UNIQEM 75 / OB3b) TaxID=595536 RepID=A0A2D2CX25_METT3|nr:MULTISPECIES: ATP-binding protein [Methylosinus]ATQ67244.1 ATP-binding protein [Methylosinus trichosporium OB3b]OBS52563.1 histidine kinase [Methylosinus sp. 3S-1]